MQTTFALAALASVAFALPQGGPTNQAPTTPSPAGCSQNYNGDFQITIVNGSSAAISKRQSSSACGKEGLLTAKLANGVLTDSRGRIGSIVANFQFQFDGPPPQAGALYTSGFSVCQNGSLAIGGSAVFYSCQSGGFSNLYDRPFAQQCQPVFINVLPCGASGGAGQQADGQPTFTSATPAVSQLGDGQPQGVTAVAAPVSQIGDGQVQAPTTAPMVPVPQVGDGQLQVPASIPAHPAPQAPQIGDGQVQAPKAAPAPAVTQVPDGQVQAPKAASAPAPAATQIPDGQVQASQAAPAPAATQIGDGQVQAPKDAHAPAPPAAAPVATPVSQIADGQIQAPTAAAAAAPVTQIGDGQIQAPSAAAAPAISQLPDGQIQTNTNTTVPSGNAPIQVAISAGKGLNAGSTAAVIVGLVAVLFL